MTKNRPSISQGYGYLRRMFSSSDPLYIASIIQTRAKPPVVVEREPVRREVIEPLSAPAYEGKRLSVLEQM